MLILQNIVTVTLSSSPTSLCLSFSHISYVSCIAAAHTEQHLQTFESNGDVCDCHIER